MPTSSPSGTSPRRHRCGRATSPGRSRPASAARSIAVAFTYLSTLLRAGARRLQPGLRPVVGGLVLAALGLASSYSLTFGEAQIGEILSHHGGTVAFFALAALAKLAGTSVTLSAEWRGGFIIPLFFIGACLGRAFHVIAPGTNEAVMIAAFMAAANTGVTKTPLGSTLVVSEMAGFRLLPTTLARHDGLVRAHQRGRADPHATRARRRSAKSRADRPIRGVAQSGMLLCLRTGTSPCLLRNEANADATARRVSRGSITAST